MFSERSDLFSFTEKIYFVMRVLVVKTSSLGDVIHTLPALTDAVCAIPDLHFDWMVEEDFQEVPLWHPAVQQVIPVGLRRWRKQPWQAIRNGQWEQFRLRLRRQRYDRVIDAQGLLKSVCLARLVPTPCVGLDRRSAREPLASWFYQEVVRVSKRKHAVERIRELFAAALRYTVPATPVEYGLPRRSFAPLPFGKKRIVFIHGTTQADKLWPETCWRQLCRKLGEEGYEIRLPWGNRNERLRAQRIAAGHTNAQVLPRTTLKDLARELLAARAVVAVDTGPGHLAAALSVPTVSLYGRTSSQLVGTYGENQVHLSGTGMSQLDVSPESVYESLRNCAAKLAA